jgi:hypothetical protein
MLCKDKNKNGGFSDLDYLHEIDDDEENLQPGGGIGMFRVGRRWNSWASSASLIISDRIKETI